MQSAASHGAAACGVSQVKAKAVAVITETNAPERVFGRAANHQARSV